MEEAQARGCAFIGGMEVHRMNSKITIQMHERDSSLDTPLDTISLDSAEEDLEDQEDGKASLCSHRLTFLLTCLAPCTDLVNVWRYPYIAYKHGGVVLIPCTILYVLIGFPLYYLEQTIGRIHAGKRGGGQCLGHLIPIFKGVGYACVTLLAFTSVYYMVIISWVLLYLFSSMQEMLPWSHCGNGTYTKGCVTKDRSLFTPCLLDLNESSELFREGNDSAGETTWIRPPSEMYFHETVVKLTADVRVIGTVSWTLLLCLLGGWIVTYLNVIKGKISFRKTAILPTIVMILFLCAIFGSITSDPGYQNGLHFYFTFDWKALRKSDMWNDAATQVVLSLGTGTGLLQLLGRRGSKYRGLVHDAVIVIVINIIISFFSGVVMFSCLGFIAKATERACVKFLPEGFGTVFSVLPAALASLPGNVVCSIIFFALLALLSLSRQEEIVMTLLVALLDKLKHRQFRKRYCFFVISVCCILFALGIVFTTPAGIHILAVIDAYVFSWPALLLGLLECVVVAWLYGFTQFKEDVDTLLQQNLGEGWKYIWSYITPTAIVGVLIFTVSERSVVSLGIFRSSFWGPILGWSLLTIVIMWIPFYMIYALATAGWLNGLEEIKKKIQPVPICDSVTKMDKHTKDGKDMASPPRILVVRMNAANSPNVGLRSIPYGFIVCPERSPKSPRSNNNKLVFTYPEVDKSYALTDSNINKMMASHPRCDEIVFYTPQMARMKRKARPEIASCIVLEEPQTSTASSPGLRSPRFFASSGDISESHFESEVENCCAVQEEPSTSKDTRLVLSPESLQVNDNAGETSRGESPITFFADVYANHIDKHSADDGDESDYVVESSKV